MSERDRRVPESPDKVEIWAKRTGRILGFVVLFLLALYLIFSYAPR
ncbi:MAG: hypothetical protein J0H08_01260 [Rhizobiales bacterium]|nr:hypothetical protein [Hyphomicrobiales bacterium]